MIQRIQSVYLLVAAILMAVTAFSPIINLQNELTLFSYGIEGVDGSVIFPTWGIISMAAIRSILSFVSIFLYKNRKKQRNFTLIAAAIVVVYFVTGMVYMSSYMKGDFSLFASISYGLFFPVIALICLLLASQRIKKDEKLVKSLNRLR